MADMASHDDTKKQWLTLAESWLRLVQTPSQERKGDPPS
jgi:hypothetical protein